jgi:hypothetical protein
MGFSFNIPSTPAKARKFARDMIAALRLGDGSVVDASADTGAFLGVGEDDALVRVLPADAAVKSLAALTTSGQPEGPEQAAANDAILGLVALLGFSNGDARSALVDILIELTGGGISDLAILIDGDVLMIDGDFLEVN